MATWTDPSTINTNPKDPITSEFGTAALENVEASAEGASGAPTWEVAWHYLEKLEPETNQATLEFTTDISTYRAVKVEGAVSPTASYQFTVDYRIATTWRSIDGLSASSSDAHLISVELSELDDGDGASFHFIKYQSANITTLNRNGASILPVSPDSSLMYSTISGAINAIRIRTNSGTFNGPAAASRSVVRLYGIKRTSA